MRSEEIEDTLPLSFIVNSCEESFPGLWKKLHWRNFRLTEKFNDPRRALADLCVCLGTAKRDGFKFSSLKNDLFVQIQVLAAMQLLENQVPIFFVEKELLAAVSASSLPQIVDWKTIQLPFESAIFIFPQKSIFIDQNKECPHLLYSRIRPGKYFFNEKNFLEQPKDAFAVATTSPFRNINYYLQIDDAFNPKEMIEMSSSSHMQLNGAEAEATNKLAQIAFSLLMAMSARPELVENGRYVGRIRKSTREIWMPNIIGKKYRLKREKSLEDNSHRSPHIHWRRGHYRLQHYGAGRVETKIIWIEPTLVNAD